MSDLMNVGWDTETYLIGAPDQLVPSIVCGSWDMGPPGVPEAVWRGVYGTGDGTELWDSTYNMWQGAYDEQYRIIIQNAAFDVCVALRYCQDVLHGYRPGRRDQAQSLYRLIWEVLEKSMDNEWENQQNPGSTKRPILVSDTIIREKLYNLASCGGINVGYRGELRYGLDVLVRKYFGVNISGKKISMSRERDGSIRYWDKDGNDVTGSDLAGSAWRLRYCELDGIPMDQWPVEAYRYALDDATWARLIWNCQEEKRRERLHKSMNSESLQVYSSVALNLTTANGFRIDQEQVARLNKTIGEQMDRLDPVLRENGVLRSNGSVNTKIVKERVEAVWDSLGRQPLLTDSGDIATNKEVQEVLAQLDPILDGWAERQKLSKLRDAFLPSLCGARVYTNFDVLKETGRTSSYGAREKKGRKPLYEAVNSQQMPRRPGIRESLLPPEGMLACSVDYGALELCSVAQATYWLFGYSVHRDKINQGYDLHSFLGSSIAMLKRPEVIGHHSNIDQAYETFMESRKYWPPRGYEPGSDSEVDDRLHIKSLAGNFRNLSKPVGLGFPGGLAEATMVVFAKTVYKVDMTLQEAGEFKELWLATYPEMKQYFQWVRQQNDAPNREGDNRYYCYVTPGFNRFRARATYCATSNGAAMQSISADGAKRSVAWLSRACAGGLAGDNPYRILDQCCPLTFIHDENIVAIPDDALATERAIAVQNLMISAMGVHMPDVRITAEPALMRRWTKEAEPEWIERPHGWEEAMGIAERTYGIEMANKMASTFRTPEGSAMRLEPFDDHHELKYVKMYREGG